MIVFYDSSDPALSVLEVTPLDWVLIIRLLIAVSSPVAVLIIRARGW